MKSNNETEKIIRGEIFLNGKIFEKGDLRKIEFDNYVEILFKNQKGKYETKKGSIKKRLHSAEFWEGWMPDDDHYSEDDKYHFELLMKQFTYNETDRDFEFIMGSYSNPFNSHTIITCTSYAQLVAAYMNGEKNIMIAGLARYAKYGLQRMFKVNSMNERGFFSEGLFWKVNKVVHFCDK